MATKYVDFNRGNDLNTGNSEAQAWKSLSKLSNLTWSAGDSILLANDSVWNIIETSSATNAIDLSNFKGSESAQNLIIGYDPNGSAVGTKPILRSYMQPDASQWTWDSSVNGWYIPCLLSPGANLWVKLGVDGYGQHMEVFSNPSSWPSFTGYGQHSNDDARKRIYVSSPSTTDPTTYFGGVKIGSPSRGTLHAYNGLQYTTITGLEFSGRYGVKPFVPNGGYSGLEITNCSMDDGAGLFDLITSHNSGSVSFGLKHCTATRMSGATVHTFCSGAGKVDLDIAHNYFTNGNLCNSFGGPIYLQTRRGTTASVHHNEISFIRNGVGSHLFDGAAIYTEVSSDGIDVFCNHVHDCAVAFQDNCGRTSRWVGNVIENCNVVMACTDASNIGMGDITFSHNHAVRISANLFQHGTAMGNTPFSCVRTAAKAMQRIEFSHNSIAAGEDPNPVACVLPDKSAVYTLESNYFHGYATQMKYSIKAGPVVEEIGTISNTIPAYQFIKSPRISPIFVRGVGSVKS